MENSLFGNSEKRKFDRRQLYYYLKVIHDDTGRIAGYLGDISTQGLMIFTKEKLEIKQLFRMRINLDKELDKELDMKGDLIFDAKSLWVEKDANPEYYTIGFTFIDLNPAGMDMVKSLIKKYGFDA
jgi:hypothetical protein